MIACIVKLVNYYFLVSLCFYIFTNSINLILFNYIRKEILGSLISTFSPPLAAAGSQSQRQGLPFLLAFWQGYGIMYKGYWNFPILRILR